MKSTTPLDDQVTNIFVKQRDKNIIDNHIYNDLMSNDKISAVMEEIANAKEKLAIELNEKIAEVTAKHEPIISSLENKLAILLKMRSKG